MADNSLVLKVLLTKFQGHIETDETRIIVGGYVRNWDKSGYSKAKKFVDNHLGKPMIVISFIMGFFLLYAAGQIIKYMWGIDVFAKNAPVWIGSIYSVAFVTLTTTFYYYSAKFLKRLASGILE